MIRLFIVTIFLIIKLSISPIFAQAITGSVSFKDANLIERYETFIRNIRCPTCEAQNIADSNAPMANILKKNIAKQMQDGQSNQEIEKYLIDRYGDFIIYQPPLSAKTFLLWLGPLLIMLIIFIVWLFMKFHHKKKQLSHDQYQELNNIINKYKD